LSKAFFVETGIGYNTTLCPHLVFESSAWMHWHLGKRGEANGSNYQWVIPNYYDLTEWDPSYEVGGYLAYFGRICDVKGLAEVVEVAKARPDLDVVICGQGDPASYLAAAKNIRYQKPLWGKERSDFLRNARALLAPSRFVEPFGGVAVEAMLCGTPVLTSPFGAFIETVEHGVTGYRCHTLGDWLAAVDGAGTLDRRAVRQHAERYDMFRLARRYDAVFQYVAELGGAGWYSHKAIGVPRVEPVRS
jgi:glycosyltransferase involved in cell wall biosynthesis